MENVNEKKKVLVAMSGGVDSTISAILLQNSGYDVVGVNFNFLDRIINNTDATNTNINNVLDEISEKYGITIYRRNYSEEFYNIVVDYFVSSYKRGITPNPCTFCNGHMKFVKLYEMMKELNCDYIATGHYANVVNVGNRYAIKKSENDKKDQSYMLWQLSQEILSHTIFPIGNRNKDDIKNIARDLGLKVAEEKESQDICFINKWQEYHKDSDYKDFIKCYDLGFDYKTQISEGKLRLCDIEELPYLRNGKFVDIDGKTLGYHDGIINYTIGQRKGLNIAFGERKFVVNIDAENNQVVLGSNEDLMSDSLVIHNVVFEGIDENYLYDNYINCEFIIKCRYRHNGTKCHIEKIENTKEGCKLYIKCDEKIRAITRGQSAVLYDENSIIMLGGEVV